MLTIEDIRSTTWRRVEKMLQERLRELRESNDADHDAIETARLRGRIQECKRILGVADEVPPSENAVPGNPGGSDDGL